MDRKIVLLDAVGTVIETHPSVVAVYQQHGARFGSSLDEKQVSQRFKVARRKLFAVDTLAADQIRGQLVSSDEIEHDLWRQFIAEVFEDVADSQGLFESLWDFFADSKNWRVYPDVASSLAELKSGGCYVAIASNFDSRLLPIIESFDEFESLDGVFCSAELGFRKPDPAFYQELKQRISKVLGESITDQQITFTGDCRENDFHGPRRQGWEAYWLDRSGSASQVADKVVLDSTLRDLGQFANRVLGMSSK